MPHEPFPYRILHARFVSPRAQRLQPLITTGLHGAFGHALKSLACLVPARPPCDGCTHRAFCAYPTLFEPPSPAGSTSVEGLGVTTRAPSPVVLGPANAVTRAVPFELRAGEPLDVRIAVVGARALSQSSLLVAALRGAAERGIGIDGDERVPLELRGVDFVDEPTAPPAERAVIELRTPVRLVEEGKVRGEIDADLLWSAVVRRLDVLARVHGNGPVRLPPGLDPSRAPFTIEERDTRVLPIRRYSSRQRRRMTWPGVVGRFRISGEALPLAWPLLEAASAVHIGKATTFGFGRFVLREATA